MFELLWFNWVLYHFKVISTHFKLCVTSSNQVKIHLNAKMSQMIQTQTWQVQMILTQVIQGCLRWSLWFQTWNGIRCNTSRFFLFDTSAPEGSFPGRVVPVGFPGRAVWRSSSRGSNGWVGTRGVLHYLISHVVIYRVFGTCLMYYGLIGFYVSSKPFQFMLTCV